MKPEWQPIETAPQFKRVLVYHPGRDLYKENEVIAVGIWSYGWETFVFPRVFGTPTHWMPLPEPPKQ